MKRKSACSQCCGSTEIEIGTVYAAEMGIFEVSEADRTLYCLEIKAYDYMLRFERSFNGFKKVGNALIFLPCAVKLYHKYNDS